mmetsp:Transcript_44960/g.66160  ORF Transcript_44960/g.66160 Transcript_44960/m.66160 type:complete len:206 (-) Transcript_44960:107-724(-)
MDVAEAQPPWHGGFVPCDGVRECDDLLAVVRNLDALREEVRRGTERDVHLHNLVLVVPEVEVEVCVQIRVCLGGVQENVFFRDFSHVAPNRERVKVQLEEEVARRCFLEHFQLPGSEFLLAQLAPCDILTELDLVRRVHLAVAEEELAELMVLALERLRAAVSQPIVVVCLGRVGIRADLVGDDGNVVALLVQKPAAIAPSTAIL